jgi:phosphoribosyl-AMP cyclohydrolase
VDRELPVVPSLEPALLERVVQRVLELEPETVALLVVGSYARGAATVVSDLDIKVVTRGAPTSPYRMWFEPRVSADPLHVSPSLCSLERFLAERAEPAVWRWALGFPVADDAIYVCATDEARTMIGDPPSAVLAAAPPELEDFVEFLTKVRRASGLNDAIGVLHFAHYAALLAPGLLRTLNREVVVRDRRSAIEAALTLEVAPEHFREDFAAALGVSEAASDKVASAALRLGRELLAFLREHNPNVDPQPDIARYLADGTLERHLGFLD